MKSIICLLIVFLTATISAGIIQYQVAVFPTVSFTSVKIVHKTPPTVQSEVRRLSLKYGLDEQLVEKIIDCESHWQQDARRDNYRKGVLWSTDVGLFQINDYYWLDTASKLGYNIYTAQGNINMGMYILQKYGSEQWVWSKYCWGK